MVFFPVSVKRKNDSLPESSGVPTVYFKAERKSTAEKILILYKHDIRKCRCCGAPVTTFRVDGGIYAVLRYDNRIREKRSPAGGLFVMQKKNIRFDCGVQQTSSKVQDSSVVDESMIIKTTGSGFGNATKFNTENRSAGA